jgi:hypothetical protein
MAFPWVRSFRELHFTSKEFQILGGIGDRASTEPSDFVAGRFGAAQSRAN